MRADRYFWRTAGFITGGLLVWAADFLFIYVFTELACARGFAHQAVWGIGVIPLFSAMPTVAAGCVTAAIIAAGVRRSPRIKLPSEDRTTKAFLNSLGIIAAGLAMIALAFVALPGLLLSRAC